MPKKPKVFISYRRQDTTGAAIAGRLYDRLVDGFGKKNVFMDIDTVRVGEDFAGLINQKVGECDALIAVIGEQWLMVSDRQGKRRLDNPDDWVRIEIATALRRGIPVIPACVYGASIPGSQDLPKPLKKLATKQAIEITHKGFHQDATRLIKDLQGIKPKSSGEEALEPIAGRKMTQLSSESYVEEAKGVQEVASLEESLDTAARPSIAEGIYLDPETGLMWTKKDNGRDIDWRGTNEYAKSLALGGFKDWRLPKIDELEKLCDPKRGGMRKIRKPFELTGWWVWSSVRKGSASAWSFSFVLSLRDHNPLDLSSGNRALCVRGSEE